MDFVKSFKQKLLSGQFDFEEMALTLFAWQAKHNSVYKRYLDALGRDIQQVKQLTDIPFLPIAFFKSQDVVSGHFEAVATFESSGTTGAQTSRHKVADLDFYQKLTQKLFEESYGPLQDWSILALLPSYLERNNSSLVAMVDYFIKESGQSTGGFYLNDLKALIQQIEKNKFLGHKTLLIGVSFALLDLAEHQEINLSDIVIMETGGMKGRRKELTRFELHEQLKSAFRVKSIHSEYGMTELFSQSYSSGEGLFKISSSFNVLIRDINDPFTYMSETKKGGINVIDLGNVQSCAFIETQDIGMKHDSQYFEVLGRFDQADIRGCNLLVL
ncbi:acyl transferase [Penaeicola halotolerans]|uniref:acyl transferase n=1 Tax=Penaeicola halotolerans TaxID=2793196 RepID=UPI001CF808C8|nr:acyl transferase [Penaeicola halotolerans]